MTHYFNWDRLLLLSGSPLGGIRSFRPLFIPCKNVETIHTLFHFLKGYIDGDASQFGWLSSKDTIQDWRILIKLEWIFLLDQTSRDNGRKFERKGSFCHSWLWWWFLGTSVIFCSWQWIKCERKNDATLLVKYEWEFHLDPLLFESACCALWLRPSYRNLSERKLLYNTNYFIKVVHVLLLMYCCLCICLKYAEQSTKLSGYIITLLFYFRVLSEQI